MTSKRPPDFRFMVWLLLFQQEAGLVEETAMYADFLMMLIEEAK